jgi:hypothetical protein
MSEANLSLDLSPITGSLEGNNQFIIKPDCEKPVLTQDELEKLDPADYDKQQEIEIKSSKSLTGKQYLLVIPITKFFQNKRNLYILINILNGRSIISLRLIEYFVVNYVLENNTYFSKSNYKGSPGYIVDNLFAKDIETVAKPVSRVQRNFDDYFMVHDNYKCQLKEYNKKNFDPFCRWIRIRLYYEKNKYFYTTVAQLNFFKWAIENYVLDYILENLDTIEKAMNDYERTIKKEKKIRKLNQQLNQQLSSGTEQDEQGGSTSAPATTGLCILDKKTKIKGRKKKEFTKTNRSILKYDCTKIIDFD